MNIVEAGLSNWQLTISVSAVVLGGVLAVAGAYLWARRQAWWPFDPTIRVQVTISLGGLGNLSVRRDREVARIAHQAWVEIVTRKAGQPLDLEHDVIDEVFNSWYELFRELRVLAKSVPGDSLRDPDTSRMIDILEQALNRGLRPALTKWQARYRAWWNKQKAEHPGEEPQALQRDYPQYEPLVADLATVNKDMIGFAEALVTIVRGKKP